jgi:hypothetical protein
MKFFFCPFMLIFLFIDEANAGTDYVAPCLQLTSSAFNTWQLTSDNTDGFQPGAYQLRPNLAPYPGGVTFNPSTIYAPNGEQYKTSYPMTFCLFKRFHLEWDDNLTLAFDLKYVLDGTIPDQLTPGALIPLTGTLIKTMRNSGQVITENLSVNAYAGGS